MPEIRWQSRALADVQRLYDFLSEKSPEAAAKVVQVIQEGSELLRTSLVIGRLMPDDSGRRELFLPFASGAYVLRYKQGNAGTIIIVRVWHSRESRYEP